MTTSTLTVTDFFLARIAEDEAVARAYRDGNSWGNPYAGDGDGPDVAYSNRFDETRVLAQCAAMRKIVEMFQTARPALGEWESDYASAAYDAVRALASIWSDHPQFDPAWS
jgi:hypothetical protein